MHSVWIWTGGGWHFHHLSCWVKISSSVNYIWRFLGPFQNSEITQPHILSWFQTMSWCLPTRLTTRATTCPMKSPTPRGGKGLWPSSELTLCTFGWKASGMTSTWIWKPPASWWHLDFSSRLWESRARSRCRLSYPRISVFIKAPCDPTKIPQWLFRPAKDWWVQLMPLIMKWWGHGKGDKRQYFPCTLGCSPTTAVQTSLICQSRRKNCQEVLSKICWVASFPCLEAAWRSWLLLFLFYSEWGLKTVYKNLWTSLKAVTSSGLLVLTYWFLKQVSHLLALEDCLNFEQNNGIQLIGHVGYSI